MAEVSPSDFNIMNHQRYWNENTPPERIKALPLAAKWKRFSPALTMDDDSAENVMEKLEKINFNNSSNNGISSVSLNQRYIDGQSGINKKKKNDSIIGKTEAFSAEESVLSMSSNGYASNSCVNDSSIFNSSDDDHPDTSTPHHLIVSNSKYKIFRPPDLVIEELPNEQNHQEIVDLAQYSPVRSPFPSNTLNDSLFGNEETPEPLRFETPPKGSYLKHNEVKMVHLLKHFGLSHFAFIFIEQEVDVELFLTLNDQDLKEIGIKRNTDRNVLISVISECNTRLFGYKHEKH